MSVYVCTRLCLSSHVLCAACVIMMRVFVAVHISNTVCHVPVCIIMNVLCHNVFLRLSLSLSLCSCVLFLCQLV